MLIHNKDDIEFVTEFSCLFRQTLTKSFNFLKHEFNIDIRDNRRSFTLLLCLLKQFTITVQVHCYSVLYQISLNNNFFLIKIIQD